MLPLQKSLEFYLKAHTVYSSQSMLFHRFFKNVLEDEPSAQSDWLESKRKSLYQDKTEFERKDLGSGGQKGKMMIRSIARTALSTPGECKRLYRLARFLKPNRVLELGTSLGLSSAYLVSGYPSMHFTGVEGDPYLADHTSKLLQEVGTEDFLVHPCSIQEALSSELNQGSKFDLVYMDGHHDYKATLAYFETVTELVTEEAVVVLDDITWSADMLQAWEEVRQHPSVTASLSYMGVGYLFFSDNFLVPLHEDWIKVGLKPWTRWWSW